MPPGQRATLRSYQQGRPTMKAAILHALGTPLVIETVPDPIAGPGEVVVDVVAAPVLSYTNEVFDGTRTYHLTFPMTPGCGAVGRVRATGPDATRLAPGDWVFCDQRRRAPAAMDARRCLR
jgi:alcohol dehydrogenase